MALVDEARVSVRAGDGGAGAASFRREKYKPKGGPDGGNGGHGGDVVLIADPNLNSLADFRVHRNHQAASGKPGSGKNCNGADALDLLLPVPVGTVVLDVKSGELVADLAAPDLRFVAARGGRGAKGNAALVSPNERAPAFAEQPEPGESFDLDLELRLVADVGLLGCPNAGKSTLLTAISQARPKVADYPFTTLSPHLGVVETDEERFVVADLPGIIEGASDGKGLGTKFLRHASRCSLLAIVVDAASEDPETDLNTVLDEVAAHDPELVERVKVIVCNKIDLPCAAFEVVRRWADPLGWQVFEVSALQLAGLAELTEELRRNVIDFRQSESPRESFAVFRPATADPVKIQREGSGFRVTSERVERMVSMTPLGNARAVRHMQRKLNSMGVEKALARAGAVVGDEVYVGAVTLEFHP